MITVTQYKVLPFNLRYFTYICPIFFYGQDRREIFTNGQTFKRVVGNLYREVA